MIKMCQFFKEFLCERFDMIMSLLCLSYLRDTQTVEMRRKVDGYKLLMMTRGGRQKGRAAL